MGSSPFWRIELRHRSACCHKGCNSATLFARGATATFKRLARKGPSRAPRPRAGPRSGAPILPQALAHGHDVSLAVLEPRGLRTASGCDAVPQLDPWHVVFLEDDAPRLEVGHLCLDVVDLPERLAGLRCACMAGLIHEDFGTAASVDHAAAVLLRRREPEGLLVESPRALEVGSGDIRANGCSRKHRVLLGLSTQARALPWTETPPASLGERWRVAPPEPKVPE